MHNVKNASIAAVAGLLSGVEPEMIKNALVSFGGVARRFEHREVRAVLFSWMTMLICLRKWKAP